MQAFKSIARSSLTAIASAIGPHRWPLRGPRLWILMYHRVIDHAQAQAEGEEPGMYVTPATFAHHLDWLRECCEVVRLGEWVDRVSTGQPVPAQACAITFDDGWRDNFQNALPALVAARLPATVFAVSGLVGTDGEFWPNRLARLLCEHADLVQQDASLAWLRELATGLPGGIAGTTVNPEARAQLIDRCKQLPDSELAQRLDEAERIAGVQSPRERPMMDWSELRAMVDTGLIDVGSHTCHHYRLRADLPANVMAREIVDSQRQIAERLGQPATLFCYPNGDYTPQAAALVASTYRAAVTTTRGINRRTDPLNTLRRIGMHEDVSDTRTRFLARLSGWR